MTVRSFYVSSNIEGRKTKLGGGVSKKDGRMTTKILQRNKGSIDEVLDIRQQTFEEKGKLMLRTRVYHDCDLLLEYVTEY